MGVPRRNADQHCRAEPCSAETAHASGSSRATRRSPPILPMLAATAPISRGAEPRGSVELAAHARLSCRCSRTSELVGAFGIFRQEVRPFTDKQIELVELRRPGRHRHREHAPARRAAPAHRRTDESLEQQTATAEVLRGDQLARLASWSRFSRPCWRMRRASAGQFRHFVLSVKAMRFARCYTQCAARIRSHARREPRSCDRRRTRLLERMAIAQGRRPRCRHRQAES